MTTRCLVQSASGVASRLELSLPLPELANRSLGSTFLIDGIEYKYWGTQYGVPLISIAPCFLWLAKGDVVEYYGRTKTATESQRFASATEFETFMAI